MQKVAPYFAQKTAPTTYYVVEIRNIAVLISPVYGFEPCLEIVKCTSGTENMVSPIVQHSFGKGDQLFHKTSRTNQSSFGPANTKLQGNDSFHSEEKR